MRALEHVSSDPLRRLASHRRAPRRRDFNFKQAEALMSATLYGLVIWQGASGLAFQPGYTSKEECQAVYQGPHVICWQYDPSITTWTAFFRTTEGPASPKGFGAVWRYPNESI